METKQDTRTNDLVLIGGCALDISSHSSKKIILKTSNPGGIGLSYGGVARNVLEVVAKLSIRPFFVTVVGNDPFGDILMQHLKSFELNPRGITVSNKKTALYNCIIDNDGDLAYGVADMKILEDLTCSHVQKYEKDIASAKIIFIDANLTYETSLEIAKMCHKHKTQLFIDPTSVPKSLNYIPGEFLKFVTYIKPNLDELFAMASAIKGRDIETIEEGIDVLLSTGVKNILLTLGERGVIFANSSEQKKYSALKVKVVNTTGAGDNFIGGFLYGLTKQKSIDQCIMFGQKASRSALQSELSVSPNLCEETLSQE